MNSEGFRNWLVARGCKPNGVNTRVAEVRRIEKTMAGLGSPHRDVDAAYEADGLAQLRDALSALSADAKAGGTRFRVLMPDSQDPLKRLVSFRVKLGQYRQFRDWQSGRVKRSDWPELEALRDAFLDRAPDFEHFAQADGTYYETERVYKDQIRARLADVLASDTPDAETGRLVCDALMPSGGPLIRWQTGDAIAKAGPDVGDAFYEAIGRLARSVAPLPDALREAANVLERLRLRGASVLTIGEILSYLFTVAGMVRPSEAAPFKIGKARMLADRLTGNRIFVGGAYDSTQVDAWLTLLRRVFRVMEDVWNWRPRDLIDVQGFAWAALDDNWVDVDDGEFEYGVEDTTEEEAPRIMPAPTNLILYGPPGTGKTFATAAEAVRLCDGALPATREQTMARYRHLADAGQVRFVTFHQSYAYEDFVEGLRPPTGQEDDAEGGFRLQPRPGIFREISALAEQARKKGSSSAFDLSGRRVFKMSLGRAGLEEDVFDAAMDGGYAVLGWGGEIDWSDRRYEDFGAVHARWNEIEPGTSGNSGNIAQIWAFRGAMKEGDLIVVSSGNKRFRAIGEVTGPYRYEPTGVRGYNHRRAVRWLLKLDEPLPAETIYDKPFTQMSCYRLADAHIKREALARMLPGEVDGTGAPDQFVLIVDEINRANISKVFGELITLIEPDKRLGAPGEIKVKLPYSGDTFGVPDNLHIVGTMNTADRSIALLDTALRRRFVFRELMPVPALLEEASERTGIDLVAMLTAINARIEYLFDRERQIGHAYLMHCRTRVDVDEAVRHRIIPLLAEYFFEDWSKVALVLGDLEGGGRFLERVDLPAPKGMADERSEPRWSWRVKSAFAADAYDAFA